MRNFQDPIAGLCMDMLAEACAPGIRPYISTPANHRYPWSGVPGQLRSTLQAKQPRGGPVERVFTGAEDLIDAFRRQTRPLLSVQLFPIHFGDAWWGYVGFDDCQAPREWDEQEITLLRTASEVMGSALQRWEAEAQARQARDELEHRFEERTRELRQRLETETALAAISSQLLTEADFEQAVQRALASVGQMLSASAVILMRAARDSGASRAAAPALRRVHGWRDPRAGGLSPAQAALFEDPGQWLGSPLVWSGAAIDFADAVHLPPELPTGREGTPPDGGIPLIVVPLAVEQRVFGALACASAARRSRRTWRPCR